MTVRLGTRSSALALAQANLVAAALRERADLDVELVPITTSGDERGGRPPEPTGDKSRWVKEIEGALLRGEIDLAVHSAKDVPGSLPDGLEIVAVPERADPRDAICGAASLDELPRGARVGTSSLRRRSLLLAARPDLEITTLRGNVDTRLRRLSDGDFDAIVLAAAGLERLGRAGGEPLPASVMTPAPGQGALALEARSDDGRTAALAQVLTHAESRACLAAERALVSSLDATCNTPVGAHAEIEDGALRLSAYVGLPDGSHWIRDELTGDPGDAGALGTELARRLRSAGAQAILDAAEAAA
ncbi:MAG: hydroxymethylbilane synthase [Thermoleophilaceae bacterium]|nr:hydroxymethylbilane synthase [Thermoleophilaceae bacterium]